MDWLRQYWAEVVVVVVVCVGGLLLVWLLSSSQLGDPERYMQRFDANMAVCLEHEYSREDCIRIVSEAM